MRTILLATSVFLFLAHTAISQNDTLIGVLHNEKGKAIRNYPVSLGKVLPLTVKTDKNGLFTLPGANLQDTLYIEIPKEGKEVRIPLNGYNYLNIKLTQSSYEAQRQGEPDAELSKILYRERNKMISSSTMNKNEIEKSRCQDIICLLRRMSGVSMIGGAIRIRGIGSINSSNDALIVLDGIPMNDQSVLTTLSIWDVEEVSILKEAAQYGVRGANGAIIIKTSK
ncbi:MAG: Plug domain-containing protein [Tannerellaceae bacterium]|nr:Plug domain-containing protein [Tannerellaceae bacterium]